MLSNAIGAEFRAVTDREWEGRPAKAVVAARVYPTDPDDLWDALTNAERLPRWFSPVSGDLRLGGRYQVEGNAGGTILRCEPAQALDLSWEFAGATSWVTVRLAREGHGVRLTLEHIFPATDLDGEHWRKYGPAAVGVGWDLGFLGLGLHLASGEAKPPETDPAWMASDEAKGFMRASADAWAAAHIASGEDPETARRMAQNTAAFYTGG
ncbi:MULTISPECIES: SRPBCC family protein [unclassified Phenylobacterium]|uniref:SRPBCC family protein n=1 Tax=unclassified Phenylobacterium TaxID=2640670 RepID=UPI00083B3F68|nr:MULTISPECIES: SRPBCC family protein [unclassified Phenylobacterium]